MNIPSSMVKTVIECLRKQIAFSKLTGKAVVHLDQFVTLPRAICDTSGIPEKGKKSNATKMWHCMFYVTLLPILKKGILHSQQKFYVAVGVGLYLS
jgi:hypothetical protein